ncbi:MAG TPA: hypothetical protein IGR64_15310 [Leptolyngbyaceae cyanobacterium M65_K2018_010]|nr:hypothetical protein [Leptolyngbyaceae cyanobacterium M65_K2018_010]
MPSLTDLNEEQLNQVLPLEHDVDHLSPKVIFSRFNITLAEIKSNLAKIGFSTADWDRNLGREERVRLHKYILSDLEVQRLIISKAFEKREVLTKYLAQVNLLENSDFGLVDLGTGATLHNALAAILETQNIKPPNSFYLGLRKVRSNKFDPPEPYLYNEIDRLGFMNIPGIITFLESVCSADHGSVVDYSYAHNSDEVHPVFKEESNQAVTDWGYPLVRTAILNFTDNLLLDSNLLNPFGDVRALIETLQKEFWLNPTLEESKAWGNFPLEDGWGKESKFLTLAAPYSFRDLPKLWWLVFKTGDVWLRRHWWHSASLKMSPPLLKITFCSGEKIIKLVKKSLKKL